MILDSLKTVLANAAKGVITHLAIHETASTLTELSGGSPAYARKPFNSVVTLGNLSLTGGSIAFNVPAGSTVAYIGAWSAETGGTCYGLFPVEVEEVYAAQGVYNLNDFDIDVVDIVDGN